MLKDYEADEMLPIDFCKECERLTKEDTGKEFADAETPTLCDACGNRTLKAWKARKEGASIEEMKRIMKTERPN